ncbi:MAG: hypothetical protein VST64_00230 [Nitrospirota bacterium]|nr:hypothetical protein [Nitrospirota bacterium]
MLIEALKALVVRLPDGNLHLKPGVPTELPEEQARKLLARAPGKVRAVESEPLSRELAGVKPHVGSVVLIRDLAGRQTLALVTDVSTKQGDPPLAAGLWFYVMAGNMGRWVHQSLIVDTAPACPRCHAVRWWLSTSGTIDCTVCHPPQPDWQAYWRDVARLTNGITQEDDLFKPVMAEVQRCDEAFLTGNFAGFQKSHMKLIWIVHRLQR